MPTSPISTITAIYRILFRIIPAKTINDYATLATLAPDSTATARSVLLRGFDPDQHHLWINTNIHTAKVQHLRRHPDAEVSLWLAQPKIQLRLRAQWRVVDVAAVIRNPALRDLRCHAWDNQPPFAKKLYIYPDGADPELPPPDFAVLLGTLYHIDALRITRANTFEHYLHLRPRNAWQTQKLEV